MLILWLNWNIWIDNEIMNDKLIRYEQNKQMKTQFTIHGQIQKG